MFLQDYHSLQSSPVKCSMSKTVVVSENSTYVHYSVYSSFRHNSVNTNNLMASIDDSLLWLTWTMIVYTYIVHVQSLHQLQEIYEKNLVQKKIRL